jgi:hypothetical protein
VHQPPDVGQRGRDVVPGLPQHGVGLLRTRPGQVAGGVDPQHHRTEAGPQAVVQVAAQAAALLLAGGDQLFPAALQLRGQ